MVKMPEASEMSDLEKPASRSSGPGPNQELQHFAYHLSFISLFSLIAPFCPHRLSLIPLVPPSFLSHPLHPLIVPHPPPTGRVAATAFPEPVRLAGETALVISSSSMRTTCQQVVCQKE